MKARVRYYDFETDEVVEKKCENFYYTTDDIFQFKFASIDEPTKIYKTIVVKHPKIDISYNGEYKKLKLVVEGYQNTKKYGYSLFTTTITIKEDEEL
jgi:hypothetical protein